MGFNPSTFLTEVNLLHRYSPFSFAASLFSSLLVTIIFWKISPSNIIINWFLACFAVFLLRYFIYRQYIQRQISISSASLWFSLFVIGSFLSGVLWGTLGIIFNSEVMLSYQQAMMVNCITVLFLTALISGMVIIHAMNMIVILSFTIPAVFPYAFYLFSQDSQFFKLLGILLMAYFIFLYLVQLCFDRRSYALFRRDAAEVEEKKNQFNN